MVDYVFSDNIGDVVKCRTDAVDVNANNFTIMQDNSGPGNFKNLSTALQVAIGRNINSGQSTTKAAMIALATTLGLNLVAYPIGSSSSSTPLTLLSQTLSAPGSFAAATGAASGQIALTWLAATNANNYVVDRATNVGFTTGVTNGIYNGPLLLFGDSGLTPATAYFYRIRSQGPGYTDSAYATATATSHA